MRTLLCIAALVLSINAHSEEVFSFVDYSGNTNQLSLHQAPQGYWLAISGLSLINLTPMREQFRGLELYESEQHLRDPNDEQAIGNYFETVKLIIRRQNHQEFERAIMVFRSMVENMGEVAPETFCPWDSDALIVIKVAADDAGNPGPQMPFCLKLAQ